MNKNKNACGIVLKAINDFERKTKNMDEVTTEKMAEKIMKGMCAKLANGIETSQNTNDLLKFLST